MVGLYDCIMGIEEWWFIGLKFYGVNDELNGKGIIVFWDKRKGLIICINWFFGSFGVVVVGFWSIGRREKSGVKIVFFNEMLR